MFVRNLIANKTHAWKLAPSCLMQHRPIRERESGNVIMVNNWSTPWENHFWKSSWIPWTFEQKRNRGFSTGTIKNIATIWRTCNYFYGECRVIIILLTGNFVAQWTTSLPHFDDLSTISNEIAYLSQNFLYCRSI